MEPQKLPGVSIEEERKAQFFIKEMRSFTDWNLEDMVADITAHIQSLKKNLFYKKEGTRRMGSANDLRDSGVSAIEHFHALYVELSYKANLGAGPFRDMQDPSKVVVRQKPLSGNDSMIAFELLADAFFGKDVTAQPLYKEPTDHALACAFALNIKGRENREKHLAKILENFKDYTTDKAFYPLPKIILGVIEERDIPSYDKESPLTERLLPYAGILDENIDQEIKEGFWNALCEGKMGGNTLAFLDALALLFLKEGTSRERKELILNTLKQKGGITVGYLSGVNYHNPLTDNAYKAYARQKYKELQEAANILE